MLEKPDLPDELLLACLQAEYGLRITRLAFLPLGADQNTAVYRAVTEAGTPYFVKLRRSDFDEIAVTLPKFYHDQGLRQIIPPLETCSGQLWAHLEPYRLILYPFVEGQDVYHVNLSDSQWVEFGRALQHIHAVSVPPALAGRIPRENFSPRWRATVRRFMRRMGRQVYADPVAAECAAFLQSKRAQVLDLVRRAHRLAQALQPRPLEYMVCHSDLHAGNILVTAGGEIFIIDWDNPILAPKERDLMYPGGGQFNNWRTPPEEQALFYQGYGPAQVDRDGLAYYRYERIVTDIALFCEQLLGSDQGGEDRKQSLIYLKSNFGPGGTLEIAYQGDKTEE
jgi:spectinomycin phosphotransferase